MANLDKRVYGLPQLKVLFKRILLFVDEKEKNELNEFFLSRGLWSVLDE